jgi:TRAP-type mannitol/chloroaromatic compound transport system permease large subunit
MLAILIFLGVFVDQVSMMLITLPIFMPIVQQLGIDPVWFGIMFLTAAARPAAAATRFAAEDECAASRRPRRR